MRGNATLRHFAARIGRYSSLTSRERDILLARINKFTLSQIGKKYKISAERVRQIERQAVSKLNEKYHQKTFFEK